MVVTRRYNGHEEMVLQPGETLVVDFGQNAAAVPSFVFKAARAPCSPACPASCSTTATAPRAAAWTVRKAVYYLSVPTDCPQRNERLGWTADTQVFTETGTFFANTDKFFHKWMRDMRDTQSEHGGFPGVAPLGQYGNEQ